jgi:hypothetical protein
MENVDERIGRLESAVLAIADMQDPAKLQFPVIGKDPRTKRMNAAYVVLDRLAGEIRSARSKT